jgi:DNA-binding YbaB/EbfC family protein
MANVFSQAKDLYKMQKEARDMQKKMKKIVVMGTSKDDLVEVKMDGTNEITSIEMDDSLLTPEMKEKLENDIKQAIKDASKKLQKEMMKDFDLEKMKSMLGGM